MKIDACLFFLFFYSNSLYLISLLVLAYIRNGSYNVWMVDWGKLSEPPCYAAAVHNMKAVGWCFADLLTKFRSDGLRTDRMTCIGHSLGMCS